MVRRSHATVVPPFFPQHASQSLRANARPKTALCTRRRPDGHGGASRDHFGGGGGNGHGGAPVTIWGSGNGHGDHLGGGNGEGGASRHYVGGGGNGGASRDHLGGGGEMRDHLWGGGGGEMVT